jgi:hypothetical protein
MIDGEPVSRFQGQIQPLYRQTKSANRKWWDRRRRFGEVGHDEFLELSSETGWLRLGSALTWAIRSDIV